MAAVAKLENGLRKLKMAQLNDDGSYGDIFTVADMTQITAETSEGETKLAAGNAVIYSKKSKGSTTGSVGFYSTDEETEAKIFGYKKNAAGNILYGMTDNKLYGMKDQKPFMALIAEFTAVNPATGNEENGYLIFPKCALGEISQDISTKDADGNETFNAKSLAFTAMALDNANKTYKLKGFGETPATLTAEMFVPNPSV